MSYEVVQTKIVQARYDMAKPKYLVELGAVNLITIDHGQPTSGNFAQQESQFCAQWTGSKPTGPLLSSEDLRYLYSVHAVGTTDVG